MEPTHAVVDTRDGYTWVKGADGALFTLATATAFAVQRNSVRSPAHRTYAVRALVPVEVSTPACTVTYAKPGNAPYDVRVASQASSVRYMAANATQARVLARADGYDVLNAYRA